MVAALNSFGNSTYAWLFVYFVAFLEKPDGLFWIFFLFFFIAASWVPIKPVKMSEILQKRAGEGHVKVVGPREFLLYFFFLFFSFKPFANSLCVP